MCVNFGYDGWENRMEQPWLAENVRETNYRHKHALYVNIISVPKKYFQLPKLDIFQKK